MHQDRIERDSLGHVLVPAHCLYGAQTARALANFPISGLKPHRWFVRATLEVKKACARANGEVGALRPEQSRAVVQACDRLLAGEWAEHFVVDVYQAGAGTSHHMNANEVIANLAEEILGGRRGEYRLVHPNDQVNYGQSTNDVVPTALRVAALLGIKELMPALERLARDCEDLAGRYTSAVKAGRTHLQDAVPMTFGQEFGSWASAFWEARRRIDAAAHNLLRVPLGGSALGTGLGTEPGYRLLAVKYLGEQTDLPLESAPDLFFGIWSLSPLCALSGALRDLAVDLGKIASDIRLLASGPRTGLAELRLPAVQPGSSIMPGKVNPVMAEMTNMVCYQVIGMDAAVSAAAAAGQLQLNVMMPLLAWNLPHMIEILGNAMHHLAGKCMEGLQVDEARGREYAEQSLALVTALNRRIGYAAAAEIAKAAVTEGISVAEAVRRSGRFTEEEIKGLLDLESLTRQPKA